jgi:hypothetical protein
METETPAVTPEASAELGVAHYFKGKRLEPFSFDRRSAYYRLNEGGEERLERAVTTVFLCTQTPDRIDRARGDGCTKFRLELSAWADEQKIGAIYWDEEQKEMLGSKSGLEAYAVSQAIWRQVASAESEPDLKNESGTESPNA